jgi:hypothetical protein
MTLLELQRRMAEAIFAPLTGAYRIDPQGPGFTSGRVVGA